jgi:hypothetical protein
MLEKITDKAHLKRYTTDVLKLYDTLIHTRPKCNNHQFITSFKTRTVQQPTSDRVCARGL